ncbi:hypothetical protein ACFVTP_13105 [Streptomyces celluloflavus]|uniref:hypothetical protein n=1 Tax=Streptomyces celluloflavus TaxID=58344 RepID=UPI0036DD3A9A
MTGPTTPENPLLYYAHITDPHPLYPSVNEQTAPSALHIIISNSSEKPVYCNYITLTFPCGDEPDQLIGKGKFSAIKGRCPQGWTVTKTGSEGNIRIDPPNRKTAKLLTYDQSSKKSTDFSVVQVTLENLHVNKEAGTARIEITENTSTDEESSHFSDKKHILLVTKFPLPAIAVQAVSDFHADKPSKNCGEDVTLTWRGPENIEYTISYGSGAKPKSGQSDTVRDFVWKGTVERDTTFYLSYAIKETTYRLSTTVTVNNPQLTALTVKGSTSLQDNVSVHGDLQTSTKGVTTFGNPVTASSLTVRGDTSINGSVTIAGNLTAKGSLVEIQSSRLNVKSATEFVDEVTFSGSAHLLGDFQDLKKFSGKGFKEEFSAPTDGFVIGHLFMEASKVMRGFPSGFLAVTSSNKYFFTTGMISADYCGSYYEVIAPVKKGSNFVIELTLINMGNGLYDTGMRGDFVWIPLSRGKASEAKFVRSFDNPP